MLESIEGVTSQESKTKCMRATGTHTLVIPEATTG
jgi:hypothetical protein